MENQHTLEATSFSLTDTIVNRTQDGGGHLSLGSAFSGATMTSTSPKRLPSELNRSHPQRSVSLDPRVSPSTIPPTHKNRTLVLCFDGTGDQFDADNSNIVQLMSLLKKDDRSKQMVYYQSGIGTYTTPQVANPISSKIAMTADLMLAWNLNEHVMSGYEFLMQTYVAGDRICLFGFSRGAYTARSLAGMIQKVGLLPANNIQQIPFAYKMYTQTDGFGWEQSIAFKKAFSIDVDIEFIGVWDTVDSVGLYPKRLPFTTSNTIVRTFRHALSLDERRAKFKANLWNRPNSREDKLGDMHEVENSIRASPNMLDPGEEDTDTASKRLSKEEKEEQILSRFEELYAEKEAHPTDVDEVWFAGCHCDVGGGSVSNKTRYSLARIPLRWMIRECFKTNTGIMFNSKGLRELGLDPSTLHPFVTPRPPPIPIGDATIKELPRKPSWTRRYFSGKKPSSPYPVPNIAGAPVNETKADKVPAGTEEEEDLNDALSPICDQLKLQRAWWILEVLPLKLRYQLEDNNWISYTSSNMGRPRLIPSQHNNGVKIHRSVKTRMDACYSRKGKKYVPRPEIEVEPTWID